MDDAGAGRNDTEVAERLLGPPQEPVTFAVALIFVRHVDAEGIGHAEGVDLHRMVDDEVDGKERVDALRIAIPASYFRAKGSEIGNDGDAGEVLEEHARRQEGQFARGQRAGRPGREPADVVLCDDETVEAAEEVLEEHADGERQAVDVGEAEFSEAVEAVVGDGAGGCFQVRESAERVIRVRHGGFFPILRLVANGRHVSYNARNLHPTAGALRSTQMAVKAYVLVVTDPTKTKHVHDEISKVPHIVELHEVMGPYDIVVEIEVETLQDIPTILGEKIRTIDGIQSTTSLVTLPD